MNRLQDAFDNMRGHRRYRMFAVVVTVVVLIGLGLVVVVDRAGQGADGDAAAGDDADASRPSSDQPQRTVNASTWGPLQLLGAEEAEYYGSVEEIALASDIVVGRLAAAWRPHKARTASLSTHATSGAASTSSSPT